MLALSHKCHTHVSGYYPFPSRYLQASQASMSWDFVILLNFPSQWQQPTSPAAQKLSFVTTLIQVLSFRFLFLFLWCFYLRYNSHALKFACSKCTNLMAFSVFLSCVFVTTINPGKFSLPRKETLHVLGVTLPPIPSSPTPRRLLVYFLSLWICPF